MLRTEQHEKNLISLYSQHKQSTNNQQKRYISNTPWAEEERKKNDS